MYFLLWLWPISRQGALQISNVMRMAEKKQFLPHGDLLQYNIRST